MTFADIVNLVIVPLADRMIIPIMYAIAFLFFLVGVARYFFSESDTDRKEGREFALWSIIGLAVLFSVWGLVRVLLSILV